MVRFQNLGLWIFSIILKFLQLLLVTFSLTMYLANCYPVLLVRFGSRQMETELEQKIITSFRGSTVLSLIETSEDSPKETKKKCVRLAVLKDKIVVWKLIVCVLSVGGLFGLQYFFYPFMLLDIVPGLRPLNNIVKAVQRNARTFIYSLLLLLIIIYIYSVIAFTFLNSDYTGVSSINLRILFPAPSMHIAEISWNALHRHLM